MKILFALLLTFCSVYVELEPLPVKIKSLGSYWHNGKVGGSLWHNILVPENIKKDELVALAKVLFKDRPGSYRFFTDEKEFQAFMMSDLHYLDDQHDNYPFPENGSIETASL
jgi:hypothetical protein